MPLSPPTLISTFTVFLVGMAFTASPAFFAFDDTRPRSSASSFAAFFDMPIDVADEMNLLRARSISPLISFVDFPASSMPDFTDKAAEAIRSNASWFARPAAVFSSRVRPFFFAAAVASSYAASRERVSPRRARVCR